jgi:plastocyanin
MKLQIAFAVGLLVGSGSAIAEDHVVLVGGNDNAFSPANTDVMVGDTVTFTNSGGEHNVASMNDAPFSFRCSADCGANGGVSNAAWSSTITIPPEAAHRTVGFYCERHGFAMSGTLTTTNSVSLQTFGVE